MKNKDTIMKYLSELMTESERTQFEKRLKNDPELKSEFEKVQSTLSMLVKNSEIEDESNYFVNLVPKVRERMQAKQRKKSAVLVPALAFAISILIIFFLQFPAINNQSGFDITVSNEELSVIVSDADSLNANELFTTNFIDDYEYYNSQSSFDEFDLYLDESIISGADLDAVNSYYVESSTSYDDFSNEQVDIIYEELINKKIL
jgi:hypothetical protein